METKNVKCEVKGTDLTMKVDLSKDFGPSSSGKTIIIGTTSGSFEVAPGVIANVTIYRKIAKK